MALYVDGFVIPVPKKEIPAYLKMARLGARVWKEHGALEVFECVGDDLEPKFGVPFPARHQGQEGRDGRVLVDPLQITREPRSGQRKGDEGPADGDPAEEDAVRPQADDL
jgi:hypothetical protein